MPNKHFIKQINQISPQIEHNNNKIFCDDQPNDNKQNLEVLQKQAKQVYNINFEHVDKLIDKQQQIVKIIKNNKLQCLNFNKYQMTASQLITYLTELSAQQLRIEFARELLANNINFSPTLILANIYQNYLDNHCQFTISHLSNLIHIVGMEASRNDVLLLFHCFDLKKCGFVDNKVFIDLLLPLNNDVLKNEVIKRIPTDIQFSMDLKYALKRLFSQMLSTKIRMKGYQKIFLSRTKDDFGQTIDKEQIRQFFKRYGKYPTQIQLNFIYKMIKNNRIQGLGVRQIKQIMKRNSRELKERMLLPTTLISMTNQRQLSPIIRKNSVKASSPIKNFSQSKNLDQKKCEFTQKTNKKAIKKNVQIEKDKNINEISKIFQNQNKKQNRSQINSPAFITQTKSIMKISNQYQHQFKQSIISDHSLIIDNIETQNKKYIIKQQKLQSLNQTPKYQIKNTSNYITPQRKKSQINITFQNKTSETGKIIKASLNKTNRIVNQQDYLKLIQSNNRLEDQIAMVKQINKERIKKIKDDLLKFK